MPEPTDPTPAPNSAPIPPDCPVSIPIADRSDPPAPTPTPAPPPAAKIVLEGTKTERELALERDLKAREQRLAELEDENGQLKRIPRTPAPAEKKAGGWTFFEGED